MLCEMCGKEAEGVVRASVEGSVLQVCPNCVKFGTVLSAPAAPSAARSGGWSDGSPSSVQERIGSHQKRMTERDLYTELPEMELDPEWSKKVRQARERLGLSQEQFGAKINEKASVVHKIESGGFVPPDALVKKLEKTLKVRLTVKAAPAPTP